MHFQLQILFNKIKFLIVGSNLYDIGLDLKVLTSKLMLKMQNFNYLLKITCKQF